jgi:hypothetical protein
MMVILVNSNLSEAWLEAIMLLSSSVKCKSYFSTLCKLFYSFHDFLLTYKIGDSLFQHVLCKQESHLAEILSRRAHHLFFTFKILRMRGNMFSWTSQVLDF